MHTKTAMIPCLLICFILAAAPCSYASDASTTPARIADAGSSVNDDPFGNETDNSAISGQDFPDPIQGFNRPMYTFNDKMYYYVLKPTAQGFAFVLPRPSRVCVVNFFYNLSMPIRALNCLFQGRGPDLGVELWRFIINSTAGVGGLFDPATKMGMQRRQEDFGKTMGRWGSGSGPYLVLPIFGPSSLRDAGGLAVDTGITYGIYSAVDPFDNDDSFAISSGITTLEAIDARHQQSFRYFESGYPFEYYLVRFLYHEKRELEIAKPVTEEETTDLNEPALLH